MVRKARTEPKERPELLVRKDPRAKTVRLVKLAKAVSRVRMVPMDQMESLERQDQRAKTATTVSKVNRVQLGRKEKKDQPDRQEPRVQRDPRRRTAKLESPAIKLPTESQENQVPKALPVVRANQEDQERTPTTARAPNEEELLNSFFGVRNQMLSICKAYQFKISANCLLKIL
jgi:hypothetical protein